MSASGWSQCPNCGGGEEDEGPFREDWEFYWRDRILHISYEGECRECKATFVVEETREFVFDPETTCVRPSFRVGWPL